MMKEKQSIENQIIDKYYNESEDLTEEINEDFQIKMEKALMKMDTARDIDFSFAIDTLEIITKAMHIKDRKKFRLELAGFITLCTAIISTILFIALNINTNIIIYSQIFITAFLPFIIIPISQKLKLGRDQVDD